MSIIVIGSGISGLNFALRAAEQGNRVSIITKKKIAESSTNYAQGGIAAVLEKTDDFNKHVGDTMKAGAFHNDRKAVEFMVRHGPGAVRRLIELGVPFATTHGKLVLTREGGHSERRIAFVGDYTGQEIERTLVKKAKQHPNIKILEYAFAIDLLVKSKACYGVSVFHQGRTKNLFANAVIVATGGLGQLFEYTTNPNISTGDGYAMAFRAGCKFQDMEFIQFHPTTFYKKGARMFLLSEALRGEGAHMRNSKGKRFVNELSPRDIVARAVYEEQKKGQIYLDIRHKDTNIIKTRFPIIYKTLKEYGFDLTKDLIPITPSAHYSCGGIKVDLHGRTNIKHLFAFGEVSGTGVHGANRLASNSLLEALVFSDQILKQSPSQKIFKKKFPDVPIASPSNHEKKYIGSIKRMVQKTMWEHVGVVRTKKGLLKAKKILTFLHQKIPSKKFHPCVWELKNIVETGLLVIEVALKRTKSLGCHFRA